MFGVLNYSTKHVESGILQKFKMLDNPCVTQFNAEYKVRLQREMITTEVRHTMDHVLFISKTGSKYVFF